MKIVVTGHQGFIGSNLVPYLEKLNHTVIGLDIKSNQNVLECALPDCDLVIHLAASTGVRDSIYNPKAYWANNVETTKRILSHYKDIRVLVAGSSSQYEPHLNPYAASKHVIESIPHSNVCFMRFHTVYGPSPRKNMFFDKLLNGSLEYVTSHERDFIHVDDVCAAISILMNSSYVGPIDVGTGVSIKIKDIRPDLPVTDGEPWERKKTQANVEQLSALGFTPTISVESFLN